MGGGDGEEGERARALGGLLIAEGQRTLGGVALGWHQGQGGRDGSGMGA